MAAGFDVVPAPAGVLATRETGVFRFIPDPAALIRSHAAVYELIGEPMRRLQAMLGVRERFDGAVRGAAPAAALLSKPEALTRQGEGSQAK